MLCFLQICDMDNDQVLKDDEVHLFQVGNSGSSAGMKLYEG